MTGPAEPVARVRVAVRRFLRGRIDDGGAVPGDLVLVACSGGADSLALAAQTAFVAPRLGLRAGAVTVDHRLQPGSAEAATRTADLCRELGLDPVLVRVAGPAPTGAGPEGAAREVRYAALEDARAGCGARGVLLGHTMDDQAETVLLALARGSGTRAVAGMAPHRDTLWRPLLGVRRSDTTASCAVLGLSVLHDPTNAADGPWRRSDGGPLPRAGLRDLVLPELSGALGTDVVPALARTAAIATDDADLLDRLAVEARRRCSHPEGGFDVVALSAEPAALRRRVLRLAATEVGIPAGTLGHGHVEAVEALVTSWRGQGPVSLPGGGSARRACGRLTLAGPPAGVPSCPEP